MWANFPHIIQYSLKLYTILPKSQTLRDGGGGRIRTYVAFRRQIYSLLRLSTPAPLPAQTQSQSPRGESNPLTYRLQVGCATIALLGQIKKPLGQYQSEQTTAC